MCKIFNSTYVTCNSTFNLSSDPASGTPDVQPGPKSQSELPERKMLDSYREVIIPLGKDQTQREKYLQTSDSVRFGRIFEDLDTMAGML